MTHCNIHDLDYGYEPCPACSAQKLADEAFDRVLEESKVKTVNETLDERAKTHGDFDEYAKIYGSLISIVTNTGKNLNFAQSAGLDMILSKIARILNGNPSEPDHWHDIAGYATLVERSICKKEDK